MSRDMQEKERRCRVLIADDHKVVAMGLGALLAPLYEIVAIVSDGGKVVSAIQTLCPAIVVLDLSMSSRCGLHILDDLRELRLSAKVLVLTMHTDRLIVEDAMRRGAAGFLPKTVGAAELLQALELVGAGKVYVSPGLLGDSPSGASDHHRVRQLTPRQREIVHLIAKGMTSESIAEALGISHWTINFHRKNIRRQLGIHSDLEMHRFALFTESDNRIEG